VSWDASPAMEIGDPPSRRHRRASPEESFC
jgi:hypothetical protein